MSRKFSEKDNRSIITRRLEAKVSLLCAKSHNKLSLQVSLKLANGYFQRCGQKVRNILHNRNEYKLLLAASYDVFVKKRMNVALNLTPTPDLFSCVKRNFWPSSHSR